MREGFRTAEEDENGMRMERMRKEWMRRDGGDGRGKKKAKERGKQPGVQVSRYEGRLRKKVSFLEDDLERSQVVAQLLL